MYRRRAREAHIHVVVGQRLQVGGLRLLADVGETLESLLDVKAGVPNYPVAVALSAFYVAIAKK